MSTLTAPNQTTFPTALPATYLPARRRFSPARIGAFFRRKHHARFMTVFVRATDAPARLGVSATRKFGSAVVRNRAMIGRVLGPAEQEISFLPLQEVSAHRQVGKFAEGDLGLGDPEVGIELFHGGFHRLALRPVTGQPKPACVRVHLGNGETPDRFDFAYLRGAVAERHSVSTRLRSP